VAPTAYRYELWHDGKLVATGRFTNERQLESGEQITIGVHRGAVREITPTVAPGDLRLVVDLVSA
jgi:hypothetical protein